MSESVSRLALVPGAKSAAAESDMPLNDHGGELLRPSDFAPEQRKTLGQHLREAREACGSQFTLESVASEIRVAPEELAAWENGEREPSGFHAFQLSRMYGVQPGWFYDLPGGFPIHSSKSDSETCDIASQLKIARERAGMTTGETALALRIPLSYYDEIEAGDRRIDFVLGVRACLLFHAKPSEVVRAVA